MVSKEFTLTLALSLKGEGTFDPIECGADWVDIASRAGLTVRAFLAGERRRDSWRAA